MPAITQLSIFVKNEPGAFASIAETLKDCNINLKAFNIAESSGFGVFRAIADDTERAYNILVEKNITVKKTEVVAVEMEDHPGGLYAVSKAFKNANLNIEYAYAYSGKKSPAVFFRVDDIDAAIEALSKEGFNTLSEEDL